MEEISLDGYRIVGLTPAAVLRQRRQVLELTQQQVADRAEIDLNQYRKFESGMRDIKRASFAIACKVIRALEMDIDGFFDGDYCLSDEVYESTEGLRYKTTGRLVNDGIDE